jgi:hypothetical protein
MIFPVQVGRQAGAVVCNSQLYSIRISAQSDADLGLGSVPARRESILERIGHQFGDDQAVGNSRVDIEGYPFSLQAQANGGSPGAQHCRSQVIRQLANIVRQVDGRHILRLKVVRE